LSYAKAQKNFSDNYLMFIGPVITEACFAIQAQWTAKELRDIDHLIPWLWVAFIVDPVYSPQVAGVAGLVLDEAPRICPSICPQAWYTCISETFQQAYSIKFQSIPSL